MSFYFLMCSERCGSNFITKMMDAHSKVSGPSTKHLINPVARNIFRYEPLSEKENWEQLLRDIYNLFNVDFSAWTTTYSFEHFSKLARKPQIATLLKALFTNEAKAQGKEHLFIKENHTYEFMPFLLLNFPDAKFVFQTRDPRDMALSWKKSKIHQGGVVKAAKQWKKDHQNCLKNHHLLASLNKSYLLKYEDLIKQTEVELKSITTFLGLDFEPAMLDYHTDSLTNKNAQSQAAWQNLSKSVMSDNSEKFKDELSDLEIKAVEKICQYEMAHLGYHTTNSKTVLDKFKNVELDALELEERKHVVLLRTEGVKENMAAKKVFYEMVQTKH